MWRSKTKIKYKSCYIYIYIYNQKTCILTYTHIRTHTHTHTHAHTYVDTLHTYAQAQRANKSSVEISILCKWFKIHVWIATGVNLILFAMFMIPNYFRLCNRCSMSKMPHDLQLVKMGRRLIPPNVTQRCLSSVDFWRTFVSKYLWMMQDVLIIQLQHPPTWLRDMPVCVMSALYTTHVTKLCNYYS